MIPILDFQARILNGPVKKSDDFDLEFSMKVRELVDKYNIKYNPEELIVDDDTADAVFNAGVELLADIGIYHMDTQRVIKLTKEEILEIAAECKENPAKGVFGQGDDEMTIEYRTGADTRAPVLYSGAPAVATQEEFIPYVLSFAQEKQVAGMGIMPGLAQFGDVTPKAGTLSEVHVALWEQEQLHKVLEMAGRPGMNMGLLATASELGAIFECLKPGRREPWNTQIGVHIMPEMKLDWAALLKAHFCQDRGIIPWQSAMTMIGGLCRDAADAAVAMVANMMGQISYGHGPTCSIFPNHLDGSWGTLATHWCAGAAMRASERNIKVATGSSISGAYHTWRHPVSFLQSAAIATVYSVCGFSYAWIAGHTGLEACLIGEVMEVTAGMDKSKANELVKNIQVKVDERIGQVSAQKPFFEAYDWDGKTTKPKPDYEAGMMEVKEELAGMGMPYK
jgi:methylamine--corrinoid protein Co-methyltransferase